VIKLGDEVKDKVTGFEGIAMARTEYLYGCVLIGVLLKVLSKDEGKPIDWVWFDEQCLDILSEAKTGGPQPLAPSR